MTNFTQNEIQLLDSLCTCTEILAAIQDLTGTRFVEDGKINEESDAYKIWRDPSSLCSGGYSYKSQAESEVAWAEDVMKRAWELADDDAQQLCWGEYSERRYL